MRQVYLAGVCELDRVAGLCDCMTMWQESKGCVARLRHTKRAVVLQLGLTSSSAGARFCGAAAAAEEQAEDTHYYSNR
jgi:hypothetical protein